MKHKPVIQNLTTNLWFVEKSEQLKRSVLPRAAIIAVIIGSALNLINQFDGLFGSETLQLLQFVLMYFTPFVVVLISQRLAFKKAFQDVNQKHASDGFKSLVATLFSYGIPLRAITIGFLVGTVNSTILLFEKYLDAGELNLLPLTLVSQIYLLPTIFGFLSQALSYRRAIAIFKC